MLVPLLAALVAAEAPPRNMTVEELPDGRFRLTIVYADGGSPMDHVRMQNRLREHAQRHCQGRGTAVAAGSTELNEAPRRRLALSQNFRCRAD